jgi:outer membrane lipoprotein carrier protein
MGRYSTVRGLLIIIAVMVCFFSVGFCKPLPDARAQRIVSAVKVPGVFEAAFRYSRYDGESADSSTVTGKIWMKGSAYRLELPDQTLISNGKVLWNYWHDIQEVHVHTVIPDDSLESFSPIDLLRLYRTSFVPVAVSHRVVDSLSYDVISMVPKEESCVISQLVLTINSKEKAIRDIQAVEKDGAVHVLTLLQLVPKKSISTDCFVFPHSDSVEIIDLR